MRKKYKVTAIFFIHLITDMMSGGENHIQFIHLPDVVLEAVLSNLTYDEIARNRIVCRRMNNVCKNLLNRGFYLLEKTHTREFNHIKSRLPRRESEKKRHPLIRHYDILSSMETRISLLFLTFAKYMETNLCCFIPGKILDETFRLLDLVNKCETLPDKNHEILREFRDLSNMAMEHFDENISPTLEQNTFKLQYLVPSEKSLETSSVYQQFPNFNLEDLEEPTSNVCSENISLKLNKIYNRLTKNNKGVYRMKSQVSELNRKFNAKLSKQSFHIKQQDSKIQEYANKIKSQDEQLADMRGQLEDLHQKLKDLIAASSSTKKVSTSDMS